MSFRIRVLLAFLPVALVPLIVFGFGARDVARERLTEQYQRRVETLASGIRDDLRRRSDDVDRRLAALRDEAVADNRLRRALLGVRAERPYLLDYASGAMRLAGLDMLLLQNDRGRVTVNETQSASSSATPTETKTAVRNHSSRPRRQVASAPSDCDTTMRAGLIPPNATAST